MLEETLVDIARTLHQETGLPDLCFGGGVALNGVANAHILAESGFERMFVPSAPGDAGCALGAALMRPYIQELARVADDTFISCYPNAGLPNPMSETGFDETPDVTSRLLHEFAAEGLVNIVGGCCGTTPEHIAAIGQAVAPIAGRALHRAGYREAA